MKHKLDCRIIQDLLPSYVDGLTSNYTNQEIEAHLKDCPDCSHVLALMREPDDISQVEDREVDFLKKVRKNTLRWKAAAGTIAILLILTILAGYLIHDRMTPKSFSDIFGFEAQNVSTCIIHDWDLNKLEINADELVAFMDDMDYYYEGITGHTMHGKSFIVQFIDNEGYELSFFWITDEDFVYYNDRTYSIQDNSKIIEYLDNLFIEN